MADNIAVTPGVGVFVSTAEITMLNGTAVPAQEVQRVCIATRTAAGTMVDRVSGAAAETNVTGGLTSQQLLAANLGRVAFIIVNDSTAILYVKYGPTASSSSYTYKLDVDATLREELYTGRVDGAWASAVGAARVTELTV